MAKRTWPRGRQCAVAVTVDFDGDLALLSADPSLESREKTLSQFRYGATRGVDRLLALFADLDVPTTWFVPGANAREHRELVERVHAAGHEIGNHGFAHEDFDRLDLAGQLSAIEAGQEALAGVAGARPRGFRVPQGDFARGLLEALAAVGIDWSSSWRGDDLPYVHPAGPVEIPLHHELEDAPYFVFNLDPPMPAGQCRIAGYADVLDNWWREFQAYQRFGLCYVLRLHPEVSGTPGRIGLVRELLQRIRATGGVWFATGSEIADWWRANHTVNEPGHPADVFARLTGGGSDA
ncbi:Polysaccharide deacetylase [Saccharopolyspora shandongensis]|uniref:Polysaccharide deacetylase n=1 Tax=Saccharopolyspora shandongensis TaxID=418495 RepID=A0A1H3R7V6_9PSEU|nr:polysaccharide deacetylase [Saccharopolyspora shandongensis]SDZ21593.1 Polysaccharide deacetylase [Saccharopolyspora shandongensis]